MFACLENENICQDIYQKQRGTLGKLRNRNVYIYTHRFICVESKNSNFNSNSNSDFQNNNFECKITLKTSPDLRTERIHVMM